MEDLELQTYVESLNIARPGNLNGRYQPVFLYKSTRLLIFLTRNRAGFLKIQKTMTIVTSFFRKGMERAVARLFVGDI